MTNDKETPEPDDKAIVHFMMQDVPNGPWIRVVAARFGSEWYVVGDRERFSHLPYLWTDLTNIMSRAHQHSAVFVSTANRSISHGRFHNATTTGYAQ